MVSWEKVKVGGRVGEHCFDELQCMERQMCDALV